MNLVIGYFLVGIFLCSLSSIVGAVIGAKTEEVIFVGVNVFFLWPLIIVFLVFVVIPYQLTLRSRGKWHDG